MLDRWFSVIKLSLSWRQFHQLPRNPAYKYEYFSKAAWLSPRPKFYRARLTLRAGEQQPPAEVDAQQPVRFRRLEDGDWPRLTRIFSDSFGRVQPFASLGDRRRLDAARDCLRFTRDGGDGPIIRPACYVALGERCRYPLGAVLVTLVPPVDLDDSWSFQWKSPPPPDCVEQRLGHAHLTWIFVGTWHAGHGVGTALLAHAASRLMELGYTELVSSFILGNDSSMLWHWRNGFKLLPYSGSLRRFRAMMRATEAKPEAESPPSS
jgi:ribosomal protein S18 acetylase RimI-like enzyme